MGCNTLHLCVFKRFLHSQRFLHFFISAATWISPFDVLWGNRFIRLTFLLAVLAPGIIVDLRALFLLARAFVCSVGRGGCRGSSTAGKSFDLDGHRFSPNFWGPDWLGCAYGSATHIFLQLVATCVYFAASVPAWLTEEFLGRDRLPAPATPVVVSAKITVPDQTKIMSSYKRLLAHARGGAEVITHLAATLAQEELRSADRRDVGAPAR